MKKRLSFLACYYVATVLVFIVAKLVFMLCYRADYAFSTADVLNVAGHGLSLDLSTALYLLIVPFLATVVGVWASLPRRLLWPYYGVVAVALALAFVADSSLYAFWQFKLDASCLAYLETPTEAMASVSAAYMAWRVVAVCATAALLFLLQLAVENAFLHHPAPTASRPARLKESLFYLLCVPLMIIGIRGGLGESTTNIGQVYFSSRQFLNHSAVNPVFSFLYSLGKSGDYIVEYDFYSDEECRRLTRGFYDTRSLSPDTLLNTTRPNILIVIMESCGGQFTELGGHDSITPRLNQLAREGVYFTQCYANSWRTDRGCVSILSGYPAFPITSVMKVPEKSRKLPAIASSLAREGYENTFVYGGDINFTNMRSYVMGSGYDRLQWKADFSQREQASAKWGVSDGITMQWLLDDIRRQEESAQPWMKTWLTLSSHEPWDVPQQKLDDPVYNAFRYLDDCIGSLVDSLRQTPQWANLLMVVLPDHGYKYKGINETTTLFSHIPMIWVGGAVKAPRVVNAICNQSDLAATLLGQLALPHGDYTFSRDVVARNYRQRLAFHTFVEGMTVIDSTGFAAYDLAAGHTMAAEGPDTLRLLRLGRALLQLSSKDLAEK